MIGSDYSRAYGFGIGQAQHPNSSHRPPIVNIKDCHWQFSGYNALIHRRNCIDLLQSGGSRDNSRTNYQKGGDPDSTEIGEHGMHAEHHRLVNPMENHVTADSQLALAA